MYLFAKRLFDITVAALALFVLLPLFVPLMILLRLTGEGKIFYKQRRVGFKGDIFELLKFATMLENSPNIGTGDITVSNDPRVLPLGRFLRKTKINELPQLLNVLQGDMSLVGPRPLTPRNFDYYSEDIKEAIITMKPGLTGMGSIVFRDEEIIFRDSQKSHEKCYREDIAPYKGALEKWYKNNRSVWIDLKIIFITVWCVLFSGSKVYTKTFNGLPKCEEGIQ
jgi:lipopolysaccharide/colanic/teichoic acid biosynthesis glycosyltransferase